MNVRGLVLSVGGAPEPLALTLDQVEPESVLFLVSPVTRPLVQELRRRVRRWPTFTALALTPDPEDLDATCRVLVGEFARFRRKHGLEPEEILVDFTGGTKVMSAALVLATADHVHRYRYVGGEERDKGGVGTVRTGKEKPIETTNPWPALALARRAQLAERLNRYRFEEAQELAEDLARKVPDERAFYRALGRAARAYAAWDRFDHRQARREFRPAAEALASYFHRREHPGARELRRRLRENLAFLEALTEAGSRPSRFLVLDLLANARRRLDEKRPDDAVARLYRAVETIAQERLWTDHGLDTARVEPNRVPGELLLGLTPKEDGTYAIGLRRSYALLEALGDPLAARFRHLGFPHPQRTPLAPRNRSILAHGFDPVPPRAARALYARTLELYGAAEEDLPSFPHWVLTP